MTLVSSQSAAAKATTIGPMYLTPYASNSAYFKYDSKAVCILVTQIYGFSLGDTDFSSSLFPHF